MKAAVRLSLAAAATVATACSTAGAGTTQTTQGPPVEVRLSQACSAWQASGGDSSAVYAEGGLDRPAYNRPGNPVPTFPRGRQPGSGQVVLAFTVDTLGRAEPCSIEVLQMSHVDFANAAISAILRWRFDPAVKDGRKVRMRVQLPFVWTTS